MIDAVDQTIFRSTGWAEDLMNLGLSIRNVNITVYLADTSWLGRGDGAFKQRLCMFWMKYCRSLFTMCHQGRRKSQSTTNALPEVGGTPTLYSTTSPTPTGVSFASPISSPRKDSLTGDWAWLTSPAPPLDSLVASVLKVGNHS